MPNVSEKRIKELFVAESMRQYEARHMATGTLSTNYVLAKINAAALVAVLRQLGLAALEDNPEETAMKQAKIKCPHCGGEFTVRQVEAEDGGIMKAADEAMKSAGNTLGSLGEAIGKVLDPKNWGR
jgi:hypothetical protein